MVKRSRARRLGESAYGLLLLAKLVATAAVVLLVLAAGVWVSWSHGRDVLQPGREQGSMRVEACGDDTCSGAFTPRGGGPVQGRVTVDKSATRQVGETIQVSVVPGSEAAVRTGTAGVAHAILPFAGALVLAAPVIAAGLRMRRTAWGSGACGVVLLAAAFALS